MNFYRYNLLNKSLLDVVTAIQTLKETENSSYTHQIRLDINPYVLSEKTKRNMAVVTSHNLQQYINKVYTIKLQENVTSWLDQLLNINREENKS